MAVVRIQLPIPDAVSNHIYQRYANGRITEKELFVVKRWLAKSPLVVSGNWYKRFNTFYLVGKGPTPSSVLDLNMTPYGIEIQ